MTAAEELELCEKNRRALVRHVDERLRPRVRDANNSIVAGARHEAAFLQHDLHAAPTVQFFFEQRGLPFPERGLCIEVFSRFDSPLLPPVPIYIPEGVSAAVATR